MIYGMIHPHRLIVFILVFFAATSLPNKIFAAEMENETDLSLKTETARRMPTLTGFYIPVMGIIVDEDEDEPGLGIEFKADLKRGSGWGARVGISSTGENPGNFIDVGLLYFKTQHDEKTTDSSVRTEAVYLEALLVGMRGSGPARFTLALGLGVGGVGFNFDRTFDNTKAAAGEMRVELGVELWERLKLQAGGGGFLWGYPTETVGYGGFATLSIGMVF